MRMHGGDTEPEGVQLVGESLPESGSEEAWKQERS